MMDLYCERTDFTFWSEPLNALTNLAFILAAACAFSLWNKTKSQLTDKESAILLVLSCNIAIIGIGSFLFHTFATKWAMFADVFPIYIYKVALLLLYPTMVLKLSWTKSIGLFLLFLLSTYLVGRLPIDLNGSQMYIPSIVMLILFTLLHSHKYKTTDWPLVAAIIAFLISITFRTIDNQICTTWPVGSHFGWHIFNGFVLFFTWKSLYNKFSLRATNAQLL
ncbi:ceramidase domain-containing protein [Catenovulum sp. SX2]|uniref:ceramidase domain-containing protein n=1 Tax=Catenovulum sp. SX2 TaxID=3398614 RepID=UPI003F873198